MIVKLLLGTCGRCGGRIVGDNLGTGRAWQHLDGPDDHHIVFGAPSDPLEVRRCIDERRDLEEHDAADAAALAFPPPGRPREVTDAEWGDNRSGRRQLLKIAADNGWTPVLSQSVTGPVADQWGRYAREADTIGLVLRRGDLFAWAIWESMPGRGKYSLSLAGATGGGFGLSVEDLKNVLRSPA